MNSTLKMLVRSPVRSALTFILLGVVTFALFSQTSEYAILAREFNKAAMQYKGVLSVEAEPPDESEWRNARAPTHLALDGTATNRYRLLTNEQIDAVSALPYVTSFDKRYMTAGVSDTYIRMDDGNPLFDFAARMVIEGTVQDIVVENEYGHTDFIITDAVQLAGRKAGSGNAYSLFSFMDEPELDEHGMTAMTFGDGRTSVMLNDSHEYGYYKLSTMKVGDRCVFVVRVHVDHLQYFIGDYMTDGWCDAVWMINGEPEGYIEQEKYAPLRELIDITNADMHTFDMVYTENMSVIPKFAEGTMIITEGRAITRDDSLSGAPVCVVSDRFAKQNEVTIGDTITVALGEQLFEQYVSLGAIAGTRERYAPAGKEVTLEIVGTYAHTEGAGARSRTPHQSYSINTIFVPSSLLPVDEATLAKHQFAPGEVSFAVDNAWNIQAFMDKSIPRIEGIGLTMLSFHDGGWLGVAEEFNVSMRLSIVRVIIFTVAVAVATLLIVYIFIGRRKKDYAIMRALGTPKNTAAKSLVLPLMAVAVVSVAAGGVAAWINTVGTINRNNALVILSEYSVDTSIPVTAAVGCLLGQLLLTLAIAAVMLYRIGKQQPLTLLQARG